MTTGTGQRRCPSDPTSADKGFGSVEPIPHGHELVGNAEYFGVAKLSGEAFHCCWIIGMKNGNAIVKQAGVAESSKGAASKKPANLKMAPVVPSVRDFYIFETLCQKVHGYYL